MSLGDDGIDDYNNSGGASSRSRPARKPAETTSSKELKDRFRIYFPTDQTVARSRGGRNVSYHGPPEVIMLDQQALFLAPAYDSSQLIIDNDRREAQSASRPGGGGRLIFQESWCGMSSLVTGSSSTVK